MPNIKQVWHLYVLSRFLRKKRDIFATFICKICCKTERMFCNGQHRQKHTETYFQTDGKRTSRASDPAFLLALRQPGDAYQLIGDYDCKLTQRG